MQHIEEQLFQFTRTIYGKLDMIIKLLEDLNNAEQVDFDLDDEERLLPQDVAIDIIPLAPPAPSFGEGNNEETQNTEIRIGQCHRLVELENERTNERQLYIQQWDGNNWNDLHIF